MKPNQSAQDAAFRLNQKVLQLETLYDANLALGASLDIEKVVGEILPLAVSMVDARSGFLFLKDEATRRLAAEHHINLDSEQLQLLQDRELLRAMRDVMQQSAPLHLEAHQLPPGFKAQHMLLAAMGDTGFIGVVDRESRDGIIPFGDEEAHLLGLMARQAGTALTNARTYKRMVEERNLNQSIVSSIANGVLSTNLQGLVVRVNPAVKRVFFDRDDFYGAAAAELFGQAGYRQIAEAIAAALADGQPRSIQRESPEGVGPILDARITALRDEQDAMIGLVVTLEDLTEQTRIQSLFRRYVSDQVVELLLDADAPPMLGGEKREATMLFVDLTGSTELLGQLGADEMVAVLNRCFTRLEDIIFRYQGTLDKYMGDGFLAVFGAPLTFVGDSRRAIESALAIREEMTRFARESGLPMDINIKQGLSRGTVLAGNIGSERRMEYTVIGESVNLAARLCQRAASGEILLSAEIQKELAADYEFIDRGRQLFKGIRTPIGVFQAMGPTRDGVVALPPRAATVGDEEVTVSLDIPMMPDMEVAASHVADAVGELMGMSNEKIDELKVALIEACINAIEHSQSKESRLKISYTITADALRIVIEDRGHGFDVEAARQKVQQRRQSGDMRRGWGLHLMEEFADESTVESDSDGTRITMVKRR